MASTGSRKGSIPSTCRLFTSRKGSIPSTCRLFTSSIFAQQHLLCAGDCHGSQSWFDSLVFVSFTVTLRQEAMLHKYLHTYCNEILHCYYLVRYWRKELKRREVKLCLYVKQASLEEKMVANRLKIAFTKHFCRLQEFNPLSATYN